MQELRVMVGDPLFVVKQKKSDEECDCNSKVQSYLSYLGWNEAQKSI